MQRQFHRLDGYHDEHKCLLNPRHTTRVVRTNFRADLFGGKKVSSFVPDQFMSRWVVERKFRDKIRQSELSGLVVDRLNIVINQSAASDVDLYILRPGGNDCLRRHTVVVPPDNYCPFCSFAPVVCPECKEVSIYCPNCKLNLFGTDERCFTAVGFPPAGYVVDLDKWDGSDMVDSEEGFIVSARFLNLAITEKARPFVAIPCLADVLACNEHELKKLQLYSERYGSHLEYIDVQRLTNEKFS